MKFKIRPMKLTLFKNECSRQHVDLIYRSYFPLYRPQRKVEMVAMFMNLKKFSVTFLHPLNSICTSIPLQPLHPFTYILCTPSFSILCIPPPTSPAPLPFESPTLLTSTYPVPLHLYPLRPSNYIQCTPSFCIPCTPTSSALPTCVPSSLHMPCTTSFCIPCTPPPTSSAPPVLLLICKTCTTYLCIP